MGKMNVYSYMKRGYEDFAIPGGEKTNPIQSQFASLGLVHRGKTIPIPIQDNRDEAATRPPLDGNPRQDESSRMTEHNLKKQTQF